MNEPKQARLAAASQLLELITAIIDRRDGYQPKRSALEIVDAIAEYCRLECSHQPPTS